MNDFWFWLYIILYDAVFWTHNENCIDNASIFGCCRAGFMQNKGSENGEQIKRLHTISELKKEQTKKYIASFWSKIWMDRLLGYHDHIYYDFI